MIFVSKFRDGLNFQVGESDGYAATTGHVSSSRMLPCIYGGQEANKPNKPWAPVDTWKSFNWHRLNVRQR